MRIWFDILTPKQLLFFDRMIEDLAKRHEILCTARRHPDLTGLVELRGDRVVSVGSFGGGSLHDKLDASLARMRKLLPMVRDFSPDATVSSCSPDASRVSYGLGIRHVGMADTPYSHTMRLSVPLLKNLLVPWLLRWRDVLGLGMRRRDITRYRAIDAAVTLRARRVRPSGLPLSKNRKNILIRAEEAQAVYDNREISGVSASVALRISEDFPDENVLVLVRYPEQYESFRAALPENAAVLKMSHDGRDLLEGADVFVGSGGTMTAESALLGVPTISYNAVPNIVERFLVRRKLAVRRSSPGDVSAEAAVMLDAPRDERRRRAKRVLDSMEDPYPKLLEVLE